MLRTLLRPAILLMNRLTGSIKPLILAVTFMLALATPTYQMISGLNADIAFSEKELRGTEYLPSTLAFMQHVQQHRAMAAAFLGGDVSYKDDLAQQQALIEEDVRALDSLQEKYGAEFKSAEQWNAVKTEWTKLREELETLSASDSNHLHIVLIGHILNFQIAIADASNLTLDPDVDTYYLMIVSTSDYPAASEYTGQARAFGAAGLASGTIDQQLSALTILLQRSRDTIEVADKKVEKVIELNPEIRPQVEQSFQEAKTQQEIFQDLLEEKILGASSVTVTTTEYIDAATNAINAQFTLINALLRQLERLLGERIQRIAAQRAIVIGAVSAFALLAAWLFSGFYLSSTMQLQELIGSLEQRVAERTRALSTVAEVSAATSTILETNKLLQEVADLTKERFGFYHAHIYLLDETGDHLALAAGAGEPGRRMVAEGHSIPLARERSLVARAARERKGITVNDVTQEPDFLPNPYLPDTHSELAAPMIVGENLIGVFDAQSDQIGRFTDEDANILTTLAAQIAAAVQNARLYTQAEIALQEVRVLVENAPEAIVIVDLATGLFADPNENAGRLYGLSREELLKVGPAQMSPPRQPDGRDSTEKAMEKINEAMQGGAPTFEWMHRDAQGRDILCEVRLARLPGRHPRVRASVTDISERKRLEGLTVQRARQQEALNRITQTIQSAATVEDAMKVAARELGHALGMKPTIVTLEPGVTDKAE